MTQELSEVMLTQAIKELLYSFRKNGGDLDYCVKQLRGDFKKAGYVSKEEIEKLEVMSYEKQLTLQQYGLTDPPIPVLHVEKIAQAQLQVVKDTLLGKKG